VKRPSAELKEERHQSRTTGWKRERMAASSGEMAGAGRARAEGVREGIMGISGK